MYSIKEIVSRHNHEKCYYASLYNDENHGVLTRLTTADGMPGAIVFVPDDESTTAVVIEPDMIPWLTVNGLMDIAQAQEIADRTTGALAEYYAASHQLAMVLA